MGGDWRKRRAALLLLSSLADESDAFRKTMLRPRGKAEACMKSAAAMCAAAIGDDREHPRVHVAALVCLGLWGQSYAPRFQKRHAVQVMPALLQRLSPSASPATCLRVRCAAVSCLILLCAADGKEEGKCCPAASLAPFQRPVLESLFALLPGDAGQQQQQQQQQQHAASLLRLHEFTLTAVSCVAAVTQASFEQYYDVFMPRVLHIVASSTQGLITSAAAVSAAGGGGGGGGSDAMGDAARHASLRRRAMETVAVIGESVSKAKFQVDAATVRFD